ncbi:glycosyltransferase family 25 protein [Veillonella intestinalis]|uniref:glycosyltransferase family 25 protein n=1 Tax=Veillonella intestinalis TaxID=2941341 RepID=UPI00203C13AC|nr:glycosyltransferase family 25 protein [Veillonella intestinalis]
MQYYFISDKQNVQRRKHIITECKKLNIAPHFFDAIMGRNLKEDTLKQCVVSNNYLSAGEIGCALSHLSIFKEFLNSEEKVLVVFEDDVRFSESFIEEDLHSMCKYIGDNNNPAVLCLYKSSQKNKAVKELKGCKIYTTYGFAMSHAYIINRAAAENILKIQTPIRFEIDIFQFYYLLGACSLYCLNRNLAIQDNSFQSEIEQSRSGRTNDEDKKRKENLKSYLKKQSIFNKGMYIYRKIGMELHRPFEGLDY